MKKVKGYTVINIDEVQKLKSRLKEINEHNIDEVMFVNGEGYKVEFSSEIIEKWKYTGLNISDFVVMNYPKNKRWNQELKN
jgi:hypothetical protein